MKRLAPIHLILFIVLGAPNLNADIYSWTDENGVQHFTNYAPPHQAEIMIKTPEIAYDEAADQERREAERLEKQQLELQELAEKQHLMAMKQEALEYELEEANRRAQEAIKRYEAAFDGAPLSDGGNNDYREGDDEGDYARSTYIYYPYYSYYRYGRYLPGYFNKHPNPRHPLRYHKRYYFRKPHFGNSIHHRLGRFNKHRDERFHRGNRLHGFRGGATRSRGSFRGGRHR
ncbi:MAG: DUF4124 domain-containing protein [Desulfobacterales bacterium]|nr:MAG: DUF4124 domain-containing protein [Desulfobacterales bacterium]